MQSGELIQDGDHSLLVYDVLEGFRHIITEFAKFSLPKDEIMLIATQYDSIENIKRFMQSRGINVSKHQSNGTLVIIDAQRGYHDADVLGVYKLALSLLLRAKNEGRPGVTWFSDVGSFFSFQKVGVLLDYEFSCPAKIEQGLKVFCSYHLKDFGRLDKSEQDQLIEHHNRAIFAG